MSPIDYCLIKENVFRNVLKKKTFAISFDLIWLGSIIPSICTRNELDLFDSLIASSTLSSNGVV